jgi:hypothetical protein
VIEAVPAKFRGECWNHLITQTFQLRSNVNEEENSMATPAENRPNPNLGADTEFELQERMIAPNRTRMVQSKQGSTVLYILAALVILVGGYYVYSNYMSTDVRTPPLTQTTPAPVTSPTLDAPAVKPPAEPSTTPEVLPTAPVTDQKTP